MIAELNAQGEALRKMKHGCSSLRRDEAFALDFFLFIGDELGDCMRFLEAMSCHVQKREK